MAHVRPIELHQLMLDVLANGKVEGNEIELLRRELYADGKIDRRAADFLVEFHKRVQRPSSPAFEKFFYQAVQAHILADGKIDAEEVAWLRQMLQDWGKFAEHERRFLHELKGQAREVSPEFDRLIAECEQHMRQGTSG